MGHREDSDLQALFVDHAERVFFVDLVGDSAIPGVVSLAKIFR